MDLTPTHQGVNNLGVYILGITVCETTISSDTFCIWGPTHLRNYNLRAYYLGIYNLERPISELGSQTNTHLGVFCLAIYNLGVYSLESGNLQARAFQLIYKYRIC